MSSKHWSALDWLYRWGRLVGAAIFFAAAVYNVAGDRNDIGGWQAFCGIAWLQLHELQRDRDRLDERCKRLREERSKLEHEMLTRSRLP